MHRGARAPFARGNVGGRRAFAKGREALPVFDGRDNMDHELGGGPTNRPQMAGRHVVPQDLSRSCQVCALVLIVVDALELAVEEAEMDLWCRPRRSEGSVCRRSHLLGILGSECIAMVMAEHDEISHRHGQHRIGIWADMPHMVERRTPDRRSSVQGVQW